MLCIVKIASRFFENRRLIAFVATASPPLCGDGVLAVDRAMSISAGRCKHLTTDGGTPSPLTALRAGGALALGLVAVFLLALGASGGLPLAVGDVGRVRGSFAQFD